MKIPTQHPSSKNNLSVHSFLDGFQILDEKQKNHAICDEVIHKVVSQLLFLRWIFVLTIGDTVIKERFRFKFSKLRLFRASCFFYFYALLRRRIYFSALVWWSVYLARQSANDRTYSHVTSHHTYNHISPV